MNGIAVVFCYIICVVTSLLIVIAKEKKISKKINQQGDNQKILTFKLPLISIVFIDFLFVFCNYIATRFKPVFTGDRRIYELDFYGIRTSPSLGLDTIIQVLRNHTDNVEILFYVTTFLTVLIVLISYNLSSDTTPLAFLFFFASQFIFNTFSVLKQSYANAFAVLCIICFLEAPRKKLLYVVGIASLLLSISFHPTGYLLIPVCIILFLKKNRLAVFVYSLAITLLFFFLDDIALYVARLMYTVAPIISIKIVQYIGETDGELSVERLTFVKGVPFYVVSILGFIKRAKMKESIENYDNYLLLSVMLSFCYLTTVYNGWLYRFAYFFYLPVGLFFAILIKNMKNRNNRIIICSFVMGTMALLTFRFVILMFLNFGGF